MFSCYPIPNENILHVDHASEQYHEPSSIVSKMTLVWSQALAKLKTVYNTETKGHHSLAPVKG